MALLPSAAGALQMSLAAFQRATRDVPAPSLTSPSSEGPLLAARG